MEYYHVDGQLAKRRKSTESNECTAFKFFWGNEIEGTTTLLMFYVLLPSPIKSLSSNETWRVFIVAEYHWDFSGSELPQESVAEKLS